jgi:hypothetical protein
MGVLIPIMQQQLPALGPRPGQLSRWKGYSDVKSTNAPKELLVVPLWVVLARTTPE